jgi:hypothetical protein
MIPVRVQKKRAVEKNFVETACHHDCNSDRMSFGKGHSDETLGEKEEHVNGNWMKDHFCYKMAELRGIVFMS